MVKIPRNPVGSDTDTIIFEAKGGISKFTNINVNSLDPTVDVRGDLEVSGDISADTLNGLDVSNLATYFDDDYLEAYNTTYLNDERETLSNYAKLPGGMIMQWGLAYANQSSYVVEVIFPTTFPASCHSIVCSTQRQSSGGSGFNHVHSWNNRKAKLIVDTNNNTKRMVFWIAIGH